MTAIADLSAKAYSDVSDAVSTFVISVIAYARLSDSCLEMKCGDTLDQQAWATIGEILYWHERRNKEPDRSDRHIRELWAKAQGAVAAAIPDVILHLERQFLRELVGQNIHLLDAYPSEICEVFKEALRRRSEISSLWFIPGTLCRAISYTISVLSELGDPSCADVLHELIDDPSLGEEAVRAVRRLRGT